MNEQQKRFENLTQEERKSLRKEFNKIVERRFKIIFWIGIGVLCLAVISGGFAIYYMLNLLLQGTIAKELYFCAIIFTVGCCASLFLTSKYHKRFSIWLNDEKRILK